MGCQLRKRERIVSDIDHEISEKISVDPIASNISLAKYFSNYWAKIPSIQSTYQNNSL